MTSIIPYITNICKRDPQSWQGCYRRYRKLPGFQMAVKLDHQPSGTVQGAGSEDKVCVWVYGLFTDVPGDYIKKPMKECTGKEITAEWLYHLGVPIDQIDEHG